MLAGTETINKNSPNTITFRWGFRYGSSRQKTACAGRLAWSARRLVGWYMFPSLPGRFFTRAFAAAAPPPDRLTRMVNEVCFQKVEHLTRV